MSMRDSAAYFTIIGCTLGSRSPYQTFFITPYFQGKSALRGLHLVNHGPDSIPAMFFVESGGALISDRAGKPGSFDPSRRKARLGIRNQSGCNTQPTSFGADIKLINFSVPYDAKSSGKATSADHSNIRKRCVEPIPETF